MSMGYPIFKIAMPLKAEGYRRRFPGRLHAFEIRIRANRRHRRLHFGKAAPAAKRIFFI